jgi:hypothetical protein
MVGATNQLWLFKGAPPATRFCLLDNYLQGIENIVWGVGVPFDAVQTFPFETRQVSM